MMWITLGILYVFTAPGVMQLVKTQEYLKPEDCFKDAVVVMTDAQNPAHMACLPILKEVKEA